VNILIEEILRIQKNLFPYLFVDRVLYINPGVKGSGKKCFTKNEWFFGENFIVPSYILIESLVQLVVITVQTVDDYSDSMLNDLNFKNIEFFGVVSVGDVLLIECSIIKIVRGIVYAEARGYANSQLICSMNLEIAVLEVFDKYLPQSK
jgi:3-hydroxyacyl-[acyl-carrier-protein] dehydratase